MWYVFYLQFTINVFQIYFLISVNKVISTMSYKVLKHTSLFILGARFFVYLIDVLGARLIIEALRGYHLSSLLFLMLSFFVYMCAKT